MSILPDWMIERDIKITPFSPNQKREGKISYGVSSYGYDARLGYKFRHFRNNLQATVIDPKNWDPEAYDEVNLTPCHNWTWRLWSKEGKEGLYTTILCKNCKKERSEDRSDSQEVCPESKQPGYIIIPPHSFVLGETLETYDLPRDVLTVVVGKSTYARCGIIVNVTPGEPEWKGRWTIEISNTNPLPTMVYAGEGICQLLFLRTDGHYEALLNAVRRLCGNAFQQAFHTLGREVPESGTGDLSKEIGMIEMLLHQELGNGTCRISYADKRGKYQEQKGMTNPKVD